MARCKAGSNASVNCLDRHLDSRGDKTALIFEPDDPSQPADCNAWTATPK